MQRPRRLAKLRSAGQPRAAAPTHPEKDVRTQPEKKAAANSSAAEVRETINSMIREKAPELIKVYSEALKKQAEEQVREKQPEKETIPAEAKKKAT